MSFAHRSATRSFVAQSIHEAAKSQTATVSVTKRNDTLIREHRSRIRTNTPRRRITAVVAKVGTAYTLKA
jgi:2-C-methyl-D-erythritol 4-phosphate cytidylyltransferase